MNYIELKCRRPESLEQTEMLVAELAEIGFESFSEDESYLLAYIPQNDFATSNLLSTTFCKNLDNRTMLAISIIKSQNWNEVWESNYTPVLIDGLLPGTCYFSSAKTRRGIRYFIESKNGFRNCSPRNYCIDDKAFIKGKS